MLRFIGPHLRNVIFHNCRRHKEDDFFALEFVVVTFERVANDGHVTKPRYLSTLNLGVFLEKSTEHQRLTAFHADIRDNLTGVFIRDRLFDAPRTSRGHDLRVSQTWRQFHANRAIG